MLKKVIARVLYRRPRLEAALSVIDKRRLTLPLLSLERVFPEFASRPVAFHELPVGPWSTPIGDVAALLKVVACARPKRTLEVGSYRGYTALMIARHLNDDARLVCLDADSRHGEAYRETPYASVIERRVARVERAAFERDRPASYDLIFLDADHSYAAVKHDTELLLDLLAPAGHFVWHDYANWGKFSGKNGVPEYLHELASKFPVAAVSGSGLAIYSPAWASGAGASLFRNALVENDNVPHADAWVSKRLRG